MKAAATEILGPGVAERLSPPAGTLARGIPRAAYVSEAFFALECEKLFPHQWVFVGHAHDIAAPGDVLPLDVAGQPILLIRDADGEIRGFHNSCRHRGRRLVDEPCKGLKLLTCPYHLWAYNLDGSLRATPHFGGYMQHDVAGFDRARYGLAPVRVGVWHDWLLVNLDGRAPPLEEFVAPIEERVAHWSYLPDGCSLDRLKHVGSIDFGEIKGNWKLVVENFIEPYHVPVVHAKTCGGQPLEDHFAIHDGRLIGSAVDKPGSSGGDSGNTVDALETSALYLVLFPNMALGFYGDSVLSILAAPRAAGRTRERFDVYVWDYVEAKPGLTEDWLDLNRRINGEDIAEIEAMQAGLASPVMDQGALLSPHWEHCIQHFERQVLEGVN